MLSMARIPGLLVLLGVGLIGDFVAGTGTAHALDLGALMPKRNTSFHTPFHLPARQ